MPLFKHLVEHNRMVLIGLCCTKSSMAEEEQGPVSQISSRPSRMQSPMRSFGRTCRWPTWQPSSVKKIWFAVRSVPFSSIAWGRHVKAMSKLCQNVGNPRIYKESKESKDTPISQISKTVSTCLNINPPQWATRSWSLLLTAFHNAQHADVTFLEEDGVTESKLPWILGLSNSYSTKQFPARTYIAFFP